MHAVEDCVHMLSEETSREEAVSTKAALSLKPAHQGVRIKWQKAVIGRSEEQKLPWER